MKSVKKCLKSGMFYLALLSCGLLVTPKAYALSETKITASAIADADNDFGFSVSSSGDRMIMGSCLDDAGETDIDSVYVLTWDGTAWVEEAQLTASDPDADSSFGCSVSIDGNYVVVGAGGDDDVFANSGAAYIFKWNGTSWDEEAKLKAADAGLNDNFGLSVSMSGDYVIIGSDRDDDDGDSSGSAYIFKRDGTNWNEEDKLTASDADAGDNFGYPVAIDGDRVIVGSGGNDDDGDSSGSAYIFKRDGTNWNEEAKLTASDAEASDQFSFSVSISGDRAIVGSIGEDDVVSNSGAAYIFKHDGTSWNEETKLTNSDAEENGRFGYAVSIDGESAVVGSSISAALGSTHLFTFNGTNWEDNINFVVSDDSIATSIGTSCGVSVFINNNRVVTGCSQTDDVFETTGWAYIYNLSDEVCDGVDNDEDGEVDEGFDTLDADSDGTLNCNDIEECDDIDNNGDGQIDEGLECDETAPSSGSSGGSCSLEGSAQPGSMIPLLVLLASYFALIHGLKIKV